MIIKVYRELWDKIGSTNKGILKRYGLGSHPFHYHEKTETIDLAKRTVPECERLMEMFEPHLSIRGSKIMISDIKAWLEVVKSDGKTGRPRSVQHFSSIAHKLLQEAPGHRLYFRDDDRGITLCYYVDEVTYTPPNTSRDYACPPSCGFDLLYTEFGALCSGNISFGPSETLRTHPAEALALKGYYLETPELRQAYLASVKRYGELNGRIGFQCWATGTATDDMDGNPSGRSSSWYWRRTNTIHMERYGEPSRVVIDLFQEDESEGGSSRRRNRRNEPSITRHYWKRSKATNTEVYHDDELSPEEAEGEADEIEIPLHPFLGVFDTKRHLRLRIHAMQLEDYVYDVDLGESLVLPQEVLDLVEILIAKKGTFKDVVAGKGVGSVILCAGPPGTGKTLTAEVYAEVMERPLYSVQASQLGLGAEDLEDELLKSFARAQRWQAILLIDEADVDVKKRGDDLEQNAIVGVFLRVLEYYGGVLFMTTNRANSVDDAIASRCVARIDYAVPSLKDQGRIWRIIADGSEIPLRNDTIAQIVQRHPRLSGRDIKNLLKLAHMVSLSKREPISPEMVDYVKRFKPTTTTGELSELDEALDAMIDVCYKVRSPEAQEL